jgi:hypothetical protein
MTRPLHGRVAAGQRVPGQSGRPCSKSPPDRAIYHRLSWLGSRQHQTPYDLAQVTSTPARVTFSAAMQRTCWLRTAGQFLPVVAHPSASLRCNDSPAIGDRVDSCNQQARPMIRRLSLLVLVSPLAGCCSAIHRRRPKTRPTPRLPPILDDRAPFVVSRVLPPAGRTG